MGNTLSINNLQDADLHLQNTSSRTQRSTGDLCATSLSPIFDLPVDIWLEIMDHLPLHAKVAMSLTCKHSMRLISPSAAEKLKKNREEKQQLLKLLERQMLGMAVLCFDCNTYHLSDPNLLSRIFRPTCKILKRHRAFAGLPKLTGATISRVMRQQRLGPQYGVPLGALSMYGTVDGFGENIEKGSNPADNHSWIWSVWSTARAVDGHLILRIEYRLRFQSDHHGDFPWRDEHPQKVLEGVVCSHKQSDYKSLISALGDFVAHRMEKVDRVSDGVAKKGGECNGCVSEYFYVCSNKTRSGPRERRSTIKGSGRIFTLVRYINLGTGQPDDQKRWKALNSTGSRNYDHGPQQSTPSDLFLKAVRVEVQNK